MSPEVRAEPDLSHLTLAPEVPEVNENLQPAEVQNPHILDKIRETRLGRAIAIGGAALALAGTVEAGSAIVEPAPAEAKQTDKRTVRETVTHDGTKITVLKLNAKVVKNVNKFKKCLSEAEKEEQPAPPVDPYANCAGGVKIKINTKVEAACPKGFYGGRAVSRLSLKQWIRTRAWARAVASGRAEAKASTYFMDKIKIKAGAWVNCVRIKDQNPQIPPTTPNIPPEQPPVIPPPVFPPPEHENRPPSTDMTPPEHVFENSQVRICTQNFDPDGDNLDTDFDALRGTTSFEFPHPTAPNVVCTNYTAPSTEGTDTVTVNVTDGQASDSDSETFPIVDDNF